MVADDDEVAQLRVEGAGRLQGELGDAVDDLVGGDQVGVLAGGAARTDGLFDGEHSGELLKT